MEVLDSTRLILYLSTYSVQGVGYIVLKRQVRSVETWSVADGEPRVTVRRLTVGSLPFPVERGSGFLEDTTVCLPSVPVTVSMTEPTETPSCGTRPRGTVVPGRETGPSTMARRLIGVTMIDTLSPKVIFHGTPYKDQTLGTLIRGGLREPSL